MNTEVTQDELARRLADRHDPGVRWASAEDGLGVALPQIAGATGLRPRAHRLERRLERVLHLKSCEPSFYMQIQTDERHDDDDRFRFIGHGLSVVGVDDVLKNEPFPPTGSCVDVQMIVGSE